LKLTLLYYKFIFIILESGTAHHIAHFLLVHTVQDIKAETMY